MALKRKEATTTFDDFFLKGTFDDDKSTNKILSKLQQLGVATSSKWGGHVVQLMLLKNSDSLVESTRGLNENRVKDPIYTTPRSQRTQSSTTNNNPTQKSGYSVAGNPANYGSSKNNKAMKVSLEMKNGEYVLKMKTVMTDQAQTAAMLLSQAAMLRQLGEKLISLSDEFVRSLR